MKNVRYQVSEASSGVADSQTAVRFTATLHGSVKEPDELLKNLYDNSHWALLDDGEQVVIYYSGMLDSNREKITNGKTLSEKLERKEDLEINFVCYQPFFEDFVMTNPNIGLEKLTEYSSYLEQKFESSNWSLQISDGQSNVSNSKY